MNEEEMWRTLTTNSIIAREREEREEEDDGHVNVEPAADWNRLPAHHYHFRVNSDWVQALLFALTYPTHFQIMYCWI